MFELGNLPDLAEIATRIPFTREEARYLAKKLANHPTVKRTRGRASGGSAVLYRSTDPVAAALAKRYLLSENPTDAEIDARFAPAYRKQIKMQAKLVELQLARTRILTREGLPLPVAPELQPLVDRTSLLGRAVPERDLGPLKPKQVLAPKRTFDPHALGRLLRTSDTRTRDVQLLRKVPLMTQPELDEVVLEVSRGPKSPESQAVLTRAKLEATQLATVVKAVADLRTEDATGAAVYGPLSQLPKDWLKTTSLVDGSDLGEITARQGGPIEGEGLLHDSERRLRADLIAWGHIGRGLAHSEHQAIARAAKVGEGEPGRDGEPAGIGNYTDPQLDEMRRILAEERFPGALIEDLLSRGIVGKTVLRPTFDGWEVRMEADSSSQQDTPSTTSSPGLEQQLHAFRIAVKKRDIGEQEQVRARFYAQLTAALRGSGLNIEPITAPEKSTGAGHEPKAVPMLEIVRKTSLASAVPAVGIIADLIRIARSDSSADSPIESLRICLGCGNGVARAWARGRTLHIDLSAQSFGYKSNAVFHETKHVASEHALRHPVLAPSLHVQLQTVVLEREGFADARDFYSELNHKEEVAARVFGNLRGIEERFRELQAARIAKGPRDTLELSLAEDGITYIADARYLAERDARELSAVLTELGNPSTGSRIEAGYAVQTRYGVRVPVTLKAPISWQDSNYQLKLTTWVPFRRAQGIETAMLLRGTYPLRDAPEPLVQVAKDRLTRLQAIAKAEATLLGFYERTARYHLGKMNPEGVVAQFAPLRGDLSTVWWSNTREAAPQEPRELTAASLGQAVDRAKQNLARVRSNASKPGADPRLARLRDELEAKVNALVAQRDELSRIEASSSSTAEAVDEPQAAGLFARLRDRVQALWSKPSEANSTQAQRGLASSTRLQELLRLVPHEQRTPKIEKLIRQSLELGLEPEEIRQELIKEGCTL